MANIFLAVPEKNLISPINYEKMIPEIKRKFGPYIKFASENSKLPEEVLAAFIAVESSGNEKVINKVNPKIAGLMQFNRQFTSNSLQGEKKLGRLTPAEEEKLASFNIKFDKNGKINREITQSDQLNAELNILIGSIILGQLADSLFDGGKFDGKWAVDKNNKLRLDRMLAVYNAGAFGEVGKAARKGNHATPFDLHNAIRVAETKTYIKKLLGKNGAMDVQVK
jgi:Transglycosylase SLT domain